MNAYLSLHIISNKLHNIYQLFKEGHIRTNAERTIAYCKEHV
ncbi:hypothetical protein VCRA2120O256_420004 [Vibrio crassostreae]|nr:hypothetical protein VCRA2118O239_410011 [Vibrio crassostreae]CAK2113698.1 hypothetical protein VCRA2110O173_460011 [Vibrio crassostreae]CAK2153982.1 hypothetical protein VCRA2113O207_510004 [Vibrio crassostreae]CAK2365149.1 hypothetical protein VCRA2113O217_420004 [Vibrio crassostreae]CAK2513299.1 hypothetical protein VCRA2119O243_430004 [Vibrio crassostreae]